MKTAIQKLHPDRFPNMTGKFRAVVGFVIGQLCTEPCINEMCILSDGIVMAQADDDIGMNYMVGEFSELQENWENLLKCAGLSKEERKWAEQRFHNNIMVYA